MELFSIDVCPSNKLGSIDAEIAIGYWKSDFGSDR